MSLFLKGNRATNRYNIENISILFAPRHLPNFSSFAPVPFLCQTTSLLIALDINVEHSCNITHHAMSPLLLWTMTWMFNISSHNRASHFVLTFYGFNWCLSYGIRLEKHRNCFLPHSNHDGQSRFSSGRLDQKKNKSFRLAKQVAICFVSRENTGRWLGQEVESKVWKPGNPE